MARSNHGGKHPAGRDGPIEVEVTELGSEPVDGQVESIQGRGLYVGFGLPWFSIHAYVGQGECSKLTARFKVDLRLLPTPSKSASRKPDPLIQVDPWA